MVPLYFGLLGNGLGRLGLFGDSMNCLGLFGIVWEWNGLGLSGILFGIVWDLRASFGMVWDGWGWFG
jgi:hypothetical protein